MVSIRFAARIWNEGTPEIGPRATLTPASAWVPVPQLRNTKKYVGSIKSLSKRERGKVRVSSGQCKVLLK